MKFGPFNECQSGPDSLWTAVCDLLVSELEGLFPSEVNRLGVSATRENHTNNAIEKAICFNGAEFFLHQFSCFVYLTLAPCYFVPIIRLLLNFHLFVKFVFFVVCT